MTVLIILIAIFICFLVIYKKAPGLKNRNFLIELAKDIESKSEKYYFASDEVKIKDDALHLAGHWVNPGYEMGYFKIHLGHPDFELVKYSRQNTKFKFTSSEKKLTNTKLQDLLVSDFLRISIE